MTQEILKKTNQQVGDHSFFLVNFNILCLEEKQIFLVIF
jgi:hypothetical protein